MRILITGANGFIGRALCRRLKADGHEIIAALRHSRPVSDLACDEVSAIDDIGPDSDWSNALRGVQTVVHLAAHVHVVSNSSEHDATFASVNVQGTSKLAQQAAALGVSRLFFLSSIKVCGEETLPGQPFRADDPVSPHDVYAVSKRDAEDSLRQIADRTGMETVILRTPLVYGAGVKGNFAALVRWLSLGLPLPLGAVTHNRRSLVALDNLIDLIAICLSHPAAPGRTFLVSDGEDLSTAELLRRLGLALDRPARLFPVPLKLLRFGARALSRRDLFRRLCGSLQVDASMTRELLGWTPPLSVDEGLRRVSVGKPS